MSISDRETSARSSVPVLPKNGENPSTSGYERGLLRDERDGGPESPCRSQSFLIVLLRALSAWNA